MSNERDILSTIVQTKQAEVAAAQQRRSFADLERAIRNLPPTRDFVGALQQARGMGLIAEVKKASPSAGIIRADFDPVAIAHTYVAHGANCLSVLTDVEYFQGSLDYLSQICAAVSVPLLRKDFLIDPYQVYEARAAGADCILLIAECLDDCTLRELYFLAGKLELDCLIELYDVENLDRVLKLDPPLVGVNNRDLRTFQVDLEHSLRLRSRVPAHTLFVSESGIRTPADVARLAQHRVNAILVGESFMREADIGTAVDRLIGPIREHQ